MKPNESHIVEKFRKKRRHCLNKKRQFFLIPFLKITLRLHSCPIDIFVLRDMSRYKGKQTKTRGYFYTQLGGHDCICDNNWSYKDDHLFRKPEKMYN